MVIGLTPYQFHWLSDHYRFCCRGIGCTFSIVFIRGRYSWRIILLVVDVVNVNVNDVVNVNVNDVVNVVVVNVVNVVIVIIVIIVIVIIVIIVIVIIVIIPIPIPTPTPIPTPITSIPPSKVTHQGYRVPYTPITHPQPH